LESPRTRHKNEGRTTHPKKDSKDGTRKTWQPPGRNETKENRKVGGNRTKNEKSEGPLLGGHKHPK